MLGFDFVIGDKVQCIRSDGCLKLGGVYTVCGYSYKPTWICLKELNFMSYNEKDFVLSVDNISRGVNITPSKQAINWIKTMKFVTLQAIKSVLSYYRTKKTFAVGQSVYTDRFSGERGYGRVVKSFYAPFEGFMHTVDMGGIHIDVPSKGLTATFK